MRSVLKRMTKPHYYGKKIESFGANIFFALILLVTRSKCVSEDTKKKKLSNFFLGNFFFVFLESSKTETYADPNLNEIRAKLNCSWKFFVPET